MTDHFRTVCLMYALQQVTEGTEDGRKKRKGRQERTGQHTIRNEMRAAAMQEEWQEAVQRDDL